MWIEFHPRANLNKRIYAHMCTCVLETKRVEGELTTSSEMVVLPEIIPEIKTMSVKSLQVCH